MSLLDGHPIGGDGETWTVPDDPEDEVPLTWPEERTDQDPPLLA